MYHHEHTNSRCASTEEIRILNAISRGSSRLANNLAIRAAEEQSDESTEEIRILNAISRVSSRLANNLAILAAEEQSNASQQNPLLK